MLKNMRFELMVYDKPKIDNQGRKDVYNSHYEQVYPRYCPITKEYCEEGLAYSVIIRDRDPDTGELVVRLRQEGVCAFAHRNSNNPKGTLFYCKGWKN